MVLGFWVIDLDSCNELFSCNSIEQKWYTRIKTIEQSSIVIGPNFIKERPNLEPKVSK